MALQAAAVQGTYCVIPGNCDMVCLMHLCSLCTSKISFDIEFCYICKAVAVQYKLCTFCSNDILPTPGYMGVANWFQELLGCAWTHVISASLVESVLLPPMHTQ